MMKLAKIDLKALDNGRLTIWQKIEEWPKKCDNKCPQDGSKIPSHGFTLWELNIFM